MDKGLKNEEPKRYPKNDGRKEQQQAYYRLAEKQGRELAYAANWMRSFFVLLLILLMVSVGLVYVSSRSSIKPYVVQVDNKTGAVLNVAAISDKQYEPTEREVEYFLWTVVRKARSIPKDIVLYGQNWSDVYSYLDSESSAKLNTMAVNEDHENRVKSGETTSVDLKSFSKLSGQQRTYQARWHETRYDNSGKVLSNNDFEGFFTISYKPVIEKEVFTNPLGIVIKDFSITKEQSK